MVRHERDCVHMPKIVQIDVIRMKTGALKGPFGEDDDCR